VARRMELAYVLQAVVTNPLAVAGSKAYQEKAPQPKSLQGLIFTQSGRRDLNPRPHEPHATSWGGNYDTE
jgi:hypothetical protein